MKRRRFLLALALFLVLALAVIGATRASSQTLSADTADVLAQPEPNALVDAIRQGKWPAQVAAHSGSIRPDRHGPQRNDPAEGIPTHAYSPFDERSNREYPCPPGGCEFVPGELLVKLKPDVMLVAPKGRAPTSAAESLNAIFQTQGVTEAVRVFPSARKPPLDATKQANGVERPVPDLTRWYKLALPKDADVRKAVAAFAADPDVEHAEPNYIYHTRDTIPDDPDYAQQWALEKIQAPAAWDIETGSPEVVIAIVDTGIDWDHPDLAANIWINPGEDLNGNGIVDPEDFNDVDDDGNGYVDDIRGYDFVSISSSSVYPGEDPGPPDNDPMDFRGHGTLVTGVAGAVTNNGFGIAGVCWNVKMMAVRAGFKNLSGGGSFQISDIAQAIQYATDNDSRVINMSFGGYGESTTMEDACDYADAFDVVMVAAAGNSNSNRPDNFPASYENVISVASSDENDSKLFNSDYGHWLDVCAPGIGILTTAFNDSFEQAWATSIATPFATGLAGLILSKRPSFSNIDVRQIIQSTTDDVLDPLDDGSHLAGWDEYSGYGRINAFHALQIESIPYARIISDLEGSTVKGTVEVTGTAAGPNFQEYILDYGFGTCPDTWHVLRSSSVPVSEDVLLSWNTMLDEDGLYTLRLTVMDSMGNRASDKKILSVRNTYISEPAMGIYTNYRIFRGGETIIIVGSTSITGFHEYTIHYGRGKSPATWIEIGRSSVPITDGIIGEWNTDDIVHADYYTLLLTVSFASGLHNTDQIPMYIDPQLMEGWPQELPNWHIPEQPATADLDGDGFKEIVFGAWDLYVFDHDGNIRAGFPIDGIYYSVVGDLDLDGDLEIIGIDDWIEDNGGGGVSAWHHDGTVVSGWPVHIPWQVFSPPVLFDLDQDGYLEIIISRTTYNKLYILNHDGTSFNNGWPKDINFPATPAIGDLDGDGEVEIVVSEGNLSGSYGSPYQVYAWHIDGSILEGWPQTIEGNGAKPSCPVIGDLDGDGELDVIIGCETGKVYAWHGNGTPLDGWPTTDATAHIGTTPALADIDGDGDLEVIVGSRGDLQEYAWHHNGVLVNGWPQPVGESGAGVYSSPSVGDIDGDGDMEILQSCLDDKLYIWHHDGTPFEGWPRLVSGQKFLFTRATPVIDDLDGDGDVEIACGGESLFSVWDLPGQYDPANIEWGTFHHDNYRTGWYGFENVKPQAITDLSLTKSGDNVILQWSPVTTDIQGNTEQVRHYKVYRSTDPAFIPTDSDLIGTTTDNQLVDADGALANYCYVVKTLDKFCNLSDVSNRVMTVCSRYDFDCDCDVDVVDIMAVASRWGCGCGDDCYDALYDLDGDWDIDIVDIMLVASRWGCRCGDECYGTAVSAISQVEPRLPMGLASVRLEPDNSMVAPGETFTVEVEIEGAVDLGGFQLALNFASAVVRVDNVTLGEFLGSRGRNTAPLGPEVDNDAGTVTFGGFRFGSEAGPSGDGVLAIITLTAKGTGSSSLGLESVQVVETGGQTQTVTVEDGAVVVGVPQRIYLPLIGEQ
jgi:subtilisin family serine protease